MDVMLSLILIMNISTSLYTIIIVNVAGNWISTGIGAGSEAMSISLSITRPIRGTLATWQYTKAMNS